MKKWTTDDIIKNLPMPSRKCFQNELDEDLPGSTGRPKAKQGHCQYPLTEMQPGDCIVCGEYSHLKQQGVIGQVTKWQKAWMPDAKFVSRQVKTKLFLWRVK